MTARRLFSRTRQGLLRRQRDESGAIAILAAVLAAALLLSASLAVDVGRVASTSRDQQGATDRAALDGLRALQDERAGGEAPGNPTLHDAVTQEVEDSLARNGFTGDSREDWEDPAVTLGYVDSGTNEFEPVYPDAAASEPPNAVRVETGSFQSFILALADDGEEIDKSAMAASEAIGTISAGSRTASIGSDGEGLVAELLSTLLGSTLDLDLVGYEGLSNADVDLQVLATELGLGTVEELADAQVTFPELMDATVAALEAEGDPATATVDLLSEMGDVVSPDLPAIDLGEILHVEPGGGAGLEAVVDAASLVMASLQVANLDNALDLDTSVLDGFADAEITVIEAPVFAVGPARQDEDGWVTVARTSQVELDLELDVEQLADLPIAGDVVSSVLDSLLDVLGDLLCGLFSACPDEDDVDLGSLGVSLTTARGTSALTGTACAGDGWIRTETALDTVALDLTTPGGLLSYDDDSLDVGAELEIAGAEEQDSEFEGPFPSEIDTVPQDVDPSFDLDLGNLGGGLEDSDLVAPVENLVNDALLGEQGVVTSLLDLLGVSLGSVDVQAHALDCDGRRLLPLDGE